MATRNSHTRLGRLQLSASLFAMTALCAPVALAQEAPKPADAPAAEAAPAPGSDEALIVVTGTRASLASALARRKNAATVVDSIVAEDVAKFPDKNVGEALSRITGVQLSRDFGEGSQVSIRGVAPDLNRVEINGISALSTSGSNGRAPDFREMASELIQSVDVFKGFTANMTEGGIGGTVSVQLRKPLDLRKPILSGTMSFQELNTYGGWTPRANLTAGANWFDKRFGLIANVTYDKVATRGDFARNTEWVRLGDWDNSPERTVTSLDPRYAAVATEAGCLTAFTATADRNNCRQQWWDYSPRIARYGIWFRDDERISGQLTGQFRVNDDIDVWAEIQYNERAQRLNDLNFGTDFTAANRVANVATDVYDGLAANSNVQVDANHNVIGYTVANTAAGLAGNFGTSSRDFALDIQSQYVNWGVNWLGEQLETRLIVSNAENEYLRRTNSAFFTAQIPGLSVTLNPASGEPTFNFNGRSMDDPANYINAGLQYRPGTEENSEKQVKLDFDFDPYMDFIKSFEFGVQYREFESIGYGGGGYTATDRTNVPTLNINQTAAIPTNTALYGTNTPGTGVNVFHNTQNVSPATLQNMITSSAVRSPGAFFDGYSLGGIPNNWIAPDFNRLATFFDTSHFNLDDIEQITVNGVVYPQLPLELGENITAMYLQTNFGAQLGPVRMDGNVGVRNVITETAGTGILTLNSVTQSPTNPNATVSTNLGTTVRTVEREYEDNLPSLNLRFSSFDEAFVVRTGVARVMARPPISELRPSGTCNIGNLPAGSTLTFEDGCGSIGNPALEPYRAWSYDLEFAYYPWEEAEARLGIFYKDIDTFVLNRTLVRDVDIFGDGRLFDVTMPINGRGAKTMGLETSLQTPFTFLPKPLDGFGAVVNYTYSKAENVGLFSALDGTELGFPGLSEHSYNVTLYYEKGPLDARLAYNGRSDWLVSAADRSGNPVYRLGEEYLDARLGFKWSKFTFFLEAKNLTDEVARTTAGSDVRLSELGWFGRRYYAGVTFKY